MVQNCSEKNVYTIYYLKHGICIANTCCDGLPWSVEMGGGGYFHTLPIIYIIYCSRHGKTTHLMLVNNQSNV